MKKNQIIVSLVLFASVILTGCKKEIDASASTFLSVEEKNSSLYFHYSSTALALSGTTGYTTFSNELLNYGSSQVFGTITLGDVGGANNDTIFTSHAAKFGIVTLPYFQSNLTSSTFADAMELQNKTIVVANANYELELTSDKIIVHTTTEFFQPTAGEDYYLSAYIIVDSLIAYQEGHPDGASTAHRKVVVDVGRPNGYDPQYLGYKVASGNIEEGYRFNLTFEANRLAAWSDPKNISVALVLTKRASVNTTPIFVNAYTHFE